LIGTAISGASEGYKSYKTGQYNKKAEALQEEEKKKQLKDARRAALARAVGASNTDVGFLNYPREQKTLEQPDFTAANMIGGLGSMGANLASSYYANQMTKPSTTKFRPYNPAGVA
jgi:hypothetical protein